MNKTEKLIISIYNKNPNDSYVTLLKKMVKKINNNLVNKSCKIKKRKRKETKKLN